MLYYILVFQFRISIIPDFPLSGWQDGLVSGKGGPTKKKSDQNFFQPLL